MSVDPLLLNDPMYRKGVFDADDADAAVAAERERVRKVLREVRALWDRSVDLQERALIDDIASRLGIELEGS